MDQEKSEKIISFLKEVDKLKSVYRFTCLADQSRQESDAEHSWHMCVMAMILKNEINAQVDIGRVLEIIIVHDLVEIYAGDTFAFDDQGRKDKEEREARAAEKLFNTLPEKQQKKFYNLWLEYEEGKTEEARFAQAIDKIQALVQNVASAGVCWQKHNVTEQMSRKRNADAMQWDRAIEDICEKLYQQAQENKMFIK
jgi:putative hydrolase of HD superfamily